MHLQRHFYPYTWISDETRKAFLTHPCPSLDYVKKTLIDDTNLELGTQKLANVPINFFGSNKTTLKRLSHKKKILPCPHVLNSNGVWYSLFWLEGPKNHQNWKDSLKICPLAPRGVPQLGLRGAMGLRGLMAPPLEVCAAPLEAPRRHSEGKSLTEEGKKRLGTAGLRPQVRAQGE